MSGLTSRNKGKRGEREVVDLLQPVVNKVYEEAGVEPPLLERNLMQSNRGGYDLVGLDWIALEVKRQETLHVGDWWRQTKEQAGTEKVPVLFYRQSRAKWRVMMYGYLLAGPKRVKAPVDISADAFLAYFELQLKANLNYDD